MPFPLFSFATNAPQFLYFWQTSSLWNTWNMPGPNWDVLQYKTYTRPQRLSTKESVKHLIIFYVDYMLKWYLKYIGFNKIHLKNQFHLFGFLSKYLFYGTIFLLENLKLHMWLTFNFYWTVLGKHIWNIFHLCFSLSSISLAHWSTLNTNKHLAGKYTLV